MAASRHSQVLQLPEFTTGLGLNCEDCEEPLTSCTSGVKLEERAFCETRAGHNQAVA